MIAYRPPEQIGTFASYSTHMTNELRPAKMPLPRFASDREAAEYFDSHSLAEIWDRLRDPGRVKLSKQLAKSIRERGKESPAQFRS